MPTYDYECPQCGCRFEKFESITAPPAGKCPSCGAPGKRLISAGAGLIFKGSGFYTTDYRSDSYKKAAAQEKETATPAAGTDKSGTKKTSPDK